MRLCLKFPPIGRRCHVPSGGKPGCSSSDGELTDKGNLPYTLNLLRLAEENKNKAIALWTGKHLQLAAHVLEAGGEVTERCEMADKMIIVSSGYGEVESESPIGEGGRHFSVSPGYSTIIPAGAEHTLRSTGSTPLRYYSVYTHPVLSYGETVR